MLNLRLFFHRFSKTIVFRAEDTEDGPIGEDFSFLFMAKQKDNLFIFIKKQGFGFLQSNKRMILKFAPGSLSENPITADVNSGVFRSWIFRVFYKLPVEMVITSLNNKRVVNNWFYFTLYC